MEIPILLLFCVIIVLFIVLGYEILYALLIGLALFIMYALIRHYSVKDVVAMCVDGIKTARNVLLIFFVIGLLTAFWRASGTIAFIVSYAGTLIRPSIFLLITFILTSVVATLTGTAFGTAATMGLICATMGSTMQYPPMMIGGAVLSGIFLGDRSSPLSASTLLVAEITHTDVFKNVKQLVKTAVVPYLLACLLYGILGLVVPYQPVTVDLSQIFGQEFHLHWIVLIPAILVIFLAAFRVSVKKSMLLSVLSAAIICVFFQGATGKEIITYIVSGYQAKTPEVSALLNGGGVFSMLYAAVVVCISSAYSGIFKKTGLLDGIQKSIDSLSKKTTPYCAAMLTSILIGVLACNQTLNVMLTKQLCERAVPSRQDLAIYLENTAIVISPLVPWSIACTVPLASINAPRESVVFAFFLYLVPLCSLVYTSFQHKTTADIPWHHSKRSHHEVFPGSSTK